MDFHKLISLRQSDRKYINKPVDREIINRCIEAARLAPSASNSQPWTFIVVDDDENYLGLVTKIDLINQCTLQ